MTTAVRTGLSDGIVGSVTIAAITTLPQLVIATAAIRLGSLILALGDIVGGDAFDTLFIARPDIFYRNGPIDSGIEAIEKVWLAPC